MGVNEYIQIGNRIKKLRKEKGFTQREVAVKLNLPFSTYSNYENNNREPSFEMLQNIAKILNIPINQLLDDEAIADEETRLFRQLLDYLDELDITIEMDENEFCEINLSGHGTMDTAWKSELLRDYKTILSKAEFRKDQFILNCLKAWYTDFNNIEGE